LVVIHICTTTNFLDSLILISNNSSKAGYERYFKNYKRLFKYNYFNPHSIRRIISNLQYSLLCWLTIYKIFFGFTIDTRWNSNYFPTPIPYIYIHSSSFFKFQYDEIKFKYFEDDEFYKISTYFLFGILLVMLPFSIFNLYKQPIQEDIINLYSHFFSKVVLTINILLLLLYLNEIINLKIKCLYNTNITIFTRRLIYCLALSSLIYHSFSLTNTLSISNEMIVHSKDLYNFKKLKEKLKNNTDILKVEILYLNRDYIFCEITTDHRKEIAIIEQKELLSIFPKKSDDEES